MNFGEAKLLQRIAEIETRLGQIKGNMESQSNQRKQIYYWCHWPLGIDLIEVEKKYIKPTDILFFRIRH